MIPENLNELVTFKGNIGLAVYDWFYFKEGFSRDLIFWLINEFNLKEKIFDPFCGSGTTLLAAKELNMNSIGIDVSPLAVFASKVKTRNYDLKLIEKEFNELKNARFENSRTDFIDKRIRELFYNKNLEQLVFYWNKIKEIKDEKTRNFFLLALIDVTGQISNTIKVGGSLRKKKKGFINVKRIFLGKANKMIKDLQEFKARKIEPEVMQADARIFRLPKESINNIITSPPYLNKIEYTSVYKLELGLYFQQQETRLRAFISDNISLINEKFSGMPLIAQAYFSDMEKVLANLYDCLKSNGMLCIVVAGGCFPDKVIESDEIIISLAEELNFKLIEKITARKIDCMAFRTKLIGKTRESIIILEK